MTFAQFASVSARKHFYPAITVNLPFTLVVLVYGIIAVCASQYFDFALHADIYSPALTYIAPAVGAVVLTVSIIGTLVRHRPNRPIIFVWQKIRGDWQVERRLLYGLPVLVVISVFFSLFTSVKSAITSMVPFYADPWAATLDRMIHSSDAWEILQPLLGFPVVTVSINFVYNIWLIVVCAVVTIAAFMAGNEFLRSQFLVAFVLTWGLLGSLLATVLSSAGPCYYALFYDGDPFAGLMSYLREANTLYPIWALTTQDTLIQSFAASKAGLASGISALPSVHVAVAALMTIFAWQASRPLGCCAFAFLVAIFLGSIHLGWHYAVDGYLSLISVPVIWWLAGKIVDLVSGTRSIQTAD